MRLRNLLLPDHRPANASGQLRHLSTGLYQRGRARGSSGKNASLIQDIHMPCRHPPRPPGFNADQLPRGSPQSNPQGGGAFFKYGIQQRSIHRQLWVSRSDDDPATRPVLIYAHLNTHSAPRRWRNGIRPVAKRWFASCPSHLVNGRGTTSVPGPPSSQYSTRYPTPNVLPCAGTLDSLP